MKCVVMKLCKEIWNCKIKWVRNNRELWKKKWYVDAGISSTEKAQKVYRTSNITKITLINKTDGRPDMSWIQSKAIYDSLLFEKTLFKNNNPPSIAVSSTVKSEKTYNESKKKKIGNFEVRSAGIFIKTILTKKSRLAGVCLFQSSL